MAKLAVINRNEKRKKLVAKYAKRRAALTAIVENEINLVAAALSGIVIPLTLDRLKVDPAVASSVFLTTVTDVVGFLAFLGLATLFLL